MSKDDACLMFVAAGMRIVPPPRTDQDCLLLLSGKTLSFSASCRFSPALRVSKICSMYPRIIRSLHEQLKKPGSQCIQFRVILLPD
jgi:hypothetical protein